MRKIYIVISFILCLTFVSVQQTEAATNKVEDLKYEVFTAENGKKEIRILGKTKDVSTLVLPEQINGYPVTEIADGAFSFEVERWNVSGDLPPSADEWQIQKVELPKTLKKIGAHAFSFNRMTSIELNEGLLEIGKNAFYGNSIEQLTITNSVVKLAPGAFYNGEQVIDVQLPPHLQSNKDNIYNNLYYESFEKNGKKQIKITGLTNPDEAYIVPAEIEGLPVTEIAPYAFTFSNEMNAPIRPNVKQLQLPASLQTIGDYAFAHTDGLLQNKLSIPQNVTTIGAHTFEQMGLVTITMGNQVKTLFFPLFLIH